MNALVQYIQESYEELKNHVTWPTYQELLQTTVVVVGCSLFLSFLIFLMDKIWIFFLGFLYA